MLYKIIRDKVQSGVIASKIAEDFDIHPYAINELIDEVTAHVMTLSLKDLNDQFESTIEDLKNDIWSQQS